MLHMKYVMSHNEACDVTIDTHEDVNDIYDIMYAMCDVTYDTYKTVYDTMYNTITTKQMAANYTGYAAQNRAHVMHCIKYKYSDVL